jgi:hypothetical protein
MYITGDRAVIKAVESSRIASPPPTMFLLVLVEPVMIGRHLRRTLGTKLPPTDGELDLLTRLPRNHSGCVERTKGESMLAFITMRSRLVRVGFGCDLGMFSDRLRLRRILAGMASQIRRTVSSPSSQTAPASRS